MILHFHKRLIFAISLFIALATQIALGYAQSFKCYYSLYSNWASNYSNVVTSTAKSCLSYKQIYRDGQWNIGAMSNSIEYCSFDYITVTLYSALIQNCCADKPMCNDESTLDDFLNFSKVSCENGLTSEKFRKVVSLPNLNATSVRQCYSCTNCDMANKGLLVNCNSTSVNACQYEYTVKNGIKLWSGKCIPLADYKYYSSSNGQITKIAACQTNMCNTPDQYNYLDSSILCQDGFYSSNVNNTGASPTSHILNFMLTILLIWFKVK